MGQLVGWTVISGCVLTIASAVFATAGAASLPSIICRHTSAIQLLFLSHLYRPKLDAERLQMALNWAMLDPNRSPVPLPNEMTITKIDSGVDLSIAMAPASSSSSSGGSSSLPDPPQTPSPANTTGTFQKLKATGRVWLTDQRVCRYVSRSYQSS